MTQEQFIHWLGGFLDGTEFTENPSLKKIKEKFDTIQSFSTHPLTYPTYPAYPNPTPNTINPYYIGDIPNYPYTVNTTGTGTFKSDVTTAKTDSTPTSGKQLLNENEG